MRKINPEHVYIIVLAFFVLCASVRYVGEYVHAAMVQPAATAAPGVAGH